MVLQLKTITFGNLSGCSDLPLDAEATIVMECGDLTRPEVAGLERFAENLPGALRVATVGDRGAGQRHGIHPHDPRVGRGELLGPSQLLAGMGHKLPELRLVAGLHGPQPAIDRRGGGGARLAEAAHALGFEGKIVAAETFGDARPGDRYCFFSATKPLVASTVWTLIGEGALRVEALAILTPPVIDDIVKVIVLGAHGPRMEEVQIRTLRRRIRELDKSPHGHQHAVADDKRFARPQYRQHLNIAEYQLKLKEAQNTRQIYP